MTSEEATRDVQLFGLVLSLLDDAAALTLLLRVFGRTLPRDSRYYVDPASLRRSVETAVDMLLTAAARGRAL